METAYLLCLPLGHEADRNLYLSLGFFLSPILLLQLGNLPFYALYQRFIHNRPLAHCLFVPPYTYALALPAFILPYALSTPCPEPPAYGETNVAMFFAVSGSTSSPFR